MRALFDDPPLVHDEDAVRRLDRRQTMGDDERRTSRHKPLECLLHGRLAFCIECARGFIEQEHGRIT